MEHVFKIGTVRGDYGRRKRRKERVNNNEIYENKTQQNTLKTVKQYGR
jgi:hypothetical protein